MGSAYAPPVPVALYERDGDRVVPSELTGGPWDPGSQHGGAPSALLTWAIESVGSPGPVQLARLTVELLRPVPIRPLSLTTDVVRPGRKVQLVRAVLREGEVEVAAAHGLRLRTDDLPLPEELEVEQAPPAGPEEGAPSATGGLAPDRSLPGFHTTATEVRFTEGGFDRPGPAMAWVQLLVPVVAGEPVSPAMRVAAAADFGNGLSWVLPPERWLFVNPDLSVHLLRLPEGEWIGMRSTTLPGGSGIGVAETALYDRGGRIGRSVQSLLLEPRA